MSNNTRLARIENTIKKPYELWYPESKVICKILGIKSGESVSGGIVTEGEVLEVFNDKK